MPNLGVIQFRRLAFLTWDRKYKNESLRIFKSASFHFYIPTEKLKNFVILMTRGNLKHFNVASLLTVFPYGLEDSKDNTSKN